MPDQRDAEIPEVLGGEVEQYFAIDRVLSERVVVLLQSEAAQPACYL